MARADTRVQHEQTRKSSDEIFCEAQNKLPTPRAAVADQCRFMMLGELSPDRSRPPRCYKSHPPLARRTARIILTPAAYAGQRRHASHASEGAPIPQPHPTPTHSVARANTDPPPPYRPRQDSSESRMLIRALERISRSPREKVDMDHAWDAYLAVQGYYVPLPTKMAFVDKYISAAEAHYSSRKTDDWQLQAWGHRAAQVLDAMSEHIIPHSRFDQWRLCLLSRSRALIGDLEGALNALHSADRVRMPVGLKDGIPFAYKMLMSSTARYKGNEEVIELIAQEWPSLSSHLDFNAAKSQEGGQSRASRSMQHVAYRIAAQVRDPTPFLEREDWTERQREAVGCFFIEALCYASMAREARAMLLKMQELRMQIPLNYKLTTIRTLSQQSSLLGYAIDMFSAVPTSQRTLPYFQLGLYIYARQGNIELAQQFFNNVLTRSDPDPEDISSLIRSHAVAGDLQTAATVFNDYFPMDADGQRQPSPQLTHYHPILHACSTNGDQAGMTFWLQDMANAGLVPDQYIYTIIINSYAAAGDMDSVHLVLQQMRDAGVQPNVVTYTIILTLLAHRKDVVSADVLFRTALKEGVAPDTRMMVALMNAHVEAGSWKGVIRTYDYIASRRKSLLSVEVFNCLMKAYVLMGSPFAVVYKLFKRLEQTNSKPDAFTYSLLVQSACDAGLMNVASDIYYDIEERALEGPGNLDVNVYILTILMAGFLRQDDKVRAKAVYDEMCERGIQPTPITFSTLLKAYGNERSAESMQYAEDFVKSLVAVPEEERTWRKPKYDSKTALQHLYAPVIAAYGKMEKPEDVTRLLQEMSDADAAPSLGIMSALLDIHRRNFNIEGVLDLWPKIYHMGLELSKKDWFVNSKDVKDTRDVRGNILCVPLSIYIDALSAAGRHAEIVHTWTEFRKQGFSFDSHNWNHLVVALVRAGQPQRAFEIVERVLLPLQELSLQTPQPRDPRPTSPLLSDSQVRKGDNVLDEPSSEPPMHRENRRLFASKVSTARVSHIENFDEEGPSDDVACHLDILQQVSPSWGTWRPHNAALTVLLTAINRLSSGVLVKPVMPHVEGDLDPDLDERPEAREVLNAIYRDCPKTVSLVLDHEEREKQRLGSDYDQEYNWG
ncbi:hypothetical protein H0H81_011578 [Sphagnurus paluster]|uniref:Pentatricopeptide repeat-containing protein n=1 Tax=Sphagnurus paluster TaxID=117069 RepID=A0A9P7GUA3_9AGAR|nr:hypothetical protein H0H81_011578 [Sphagnurus paluster]